MESLEYIDYLTKVAADHQAGRTAIGVQPSEMQLLRQMLVAENKLKEKK